MSSELSSGSNPTSPSLATKKKGVDGPAPKAQPEDTSDVNFPTEEDGMPLNPGEQTVQFIPGQDPSNGDAKVEIGENVGQPKFVGLGKEELMKFANDPFWVRLRWILFILFWLIWLAMLAGAIVIILYAPKCPDKLNGPTGGPYYHIDLQTYAENKLDGVTDERIDYLQAMGVKSVIISQILAVDSRSGNGVTDFKKVGDVGSLSDLQALITRLKNKAISVLLEFIPNHSSINHPWFRNESIRSNYYVVKNANDSSTWASQLTLNEPGTAWTSVPDDDGLTYLHQFGVDVADLNLRNEEVIRELNQALQHWHNVGVDGFLLSDVSFLRENLDKLNDQLAMINQPNNDAVIKKLVDSSKWNLTGPDGTERKAAFALVELNQINPEKTSGFYSEHTAAVSNSLADLSANFTGHDLKKAIEHTLNAVQRNPVHWRLGDLSSRAASKFNSPKADALATVAALLRGQFIISQGDENGASGPRFQQPNANDPRPQFYRQLFNASSIFNQTGAGGGSTEIEVQENDPGVFVMHRNNDNEFIVAANFGKKESIVSLQTFKGQTVAHVIAATPNSNISDGTEYDAAANSIRLQPESAVVLQLDKGM